MKKFLIVAAMLAIIPLTGCLGGSNADTVSKNISKEAEKFKVARRIVVTNSITDKVEFQVEGRCSWESRHRRLDVICLDDTKLKNKASGYTKASIGLGDNTTWASVQLKPINVSQYRTKIIIRPTSIIPDLDLVTGEQEQPR